VRHANLQMTATPVSKEEVRLLAIQIGVREAARRLGLSEDRVRQWSSRYDWFTQSPKTQTVTTVTKPSVALMDELSENGNETKIKLSRYAKKQAEHLATKGKLKDHLAFKNIASGAGSLHGWDESKQGNQFTLNVLNVGSFGVTVGDQDAEP